MSCFVENPASKPVETHLKCGQFVTFVKAAFLTNAKCVFLFVSQPFETSSSAAPGQDMTPPPSNETNSKTLVTEAFHERIPGAHQL